MWDYGKAILFLRDARLNCTDIAAAKDAPHVLAILADVTQMQTWVLSYSDAHYLGRLLKMLKAE